MSFLERLRPSCILHVFAKRLPRSERKSNSQGFAQRVDWHSLELANTLHDLPQLRVS